MQGEASLPSRLGRTSHAQTGSLMSLGRTTQRPSSATPKMNKFKSAIQMSIYTAFNSRT